MWNYSEKLMDHFLHPRNAGEVENPDAVGEVGNITCGDALRLTLKIDQDERITDARFQTFGCGSAIASSSVLTEMVKGLTLDEASKITNKDIIVLFLFGKVLYVFCHCRNFADASFVFRAVLGLLAVIDMHTGKYKIKPARLKAATEWRACKLSLFGYITDLTIER